MSVEKRLMVLTQTITGRLDVQMSLVGQRFGAIRPIQIQGDATVDHAAVYETVTNDT